MKKIKYLIGLTIMLFCMSLICIGCSEKKSESDNQVKTEQKKKGEVRKKEEKRKVLPMISTGIIRSIDNLGRIVLPKELRSSYGITPETPLEIMTEGEMILLRKYQPADACIFCNEVKPGTVMLHGKRICPTCRRELEKL